MPEPTQTHRPTVVLIPGLLRTASSLSLLAERLSFCGYRVARFDYRRTERPGDVEQRLQRAILDLDSAVHLIGHSYGGLIGVGACQRPEVARRIKGVICLGTPLRGSKTAQRLRSHRVGKALLDVAGGYVSIPLPYPRVPAEVVMIAGERGRGPGLLLGRLGTPNDGTVGVAETAWPGLKEHIRLPVTHGELLRDKLVATHVIAYLRTGSLLGLASVADEQTEQSRAA